MFPKIQSEKTGMFRPDSEVAAAAEANEYNTEKANFISFIVPK
jgi:hypothetical protein